jgi:sugar/nucleoside kinase (ribokinase family)
LKKVITIGEILVEIMATGIGEGFLEPIPLIGPFPSGAPAIFIDQVAKLGQPCGIVACVGADDFGRVNLDRLARDGVDISAIAIHPELPTGGAFVRYRADGSRDFVYNIAHSAAGATGPSAAAERLIGAADHLHVMGSSMSTPAIVELVLAAAARIRARGGSVSFDPNLRKEVLATAGVRATMERVLALTDLFLPSGPELFLFTRATDEPAAARELLARGIKAVVVKNGAGGASYHAPGTALACPAFRVEEIDPTGAGDTFAGPSSPAGSATCRRTKPSASPMPPAPWLSAGGVRWKAPRRRPSSTPSAGAAHDGFPRRPGAAACPRRARRNHLGLLRPPGRHRGRPPSRGRGRLARPDRGDLQPGEPGRWLHRDDPGRLPRVRRGDR